MHDSCVQNIVIAAKTTEPHPKLPGTIYTAARECDEAGAAATLALKVDIMDDGDIERMVDATTAKFGAIDILINNASAVGAIWDTHTRTCDQF